MRISFLFTTLLILLFCCYSNAQDLEADATLNYITPSSETGGISLNVTGGTPPYEYNWTKNNDPITESSGILTGLGMGTYRVTITDANLRTVSNIYRLYRTGLWDSFSGLDYDGVYFSKSDDNTSEYGAALSDNFFETGNWKFIEFDIHEVNATTIWGYVPNGDMPESPDEILYGFRLNEEDNSLEIIEQGDLRLRTEFEDGVRLRIMFNTNLNQVRYYKDDVYMKRTTFDDIIPMEVGLLVREGIGSSLSWNTNLLYREYKFGGNYVEVRKKLDGAFLQILPETQLNSEGLLVSVHNLRFKYTERYAIVDGENEKIQCRITDWKGDDTYQGVGEYELDNKYGINWQSIDLSDFNLIGGEFYILKINGANKGETYYLKFRR